MEKHGGVDNRGGKPARFRGMKKNGRELADVMDLDEVYYDARHMRARARLLWKRDAGEKENRRGRKGRKGIIGNEVMRNGELSGTGEKGRGVEGQ